MENEHAHLEVQDWGVLDYRRAWDRQKRYVDARISGETPDRLVVVEHPPVVTMGKSADGGDLCQAEQVLTQQGVDVVRIERGGRATCHNPGQLVVYPIVALAKQDPHWYVDTFLRVVGRVLEHHGLHPVFKEKNPGIWVNGKKIASIGISLKRWVTFHGLALNVNNDLSLFTSIVPCGHPEETMTSMAAELGTAVDIAELKKMLVREFSLDFGYEARPTPRHPEWLRLSSPQSATGAATQQLLDDLRLDTVCQSAHCPNIGECFGRGTATFLILGHQCTRNCRFCAIDTAPPAPVDREEPWRVAQAVKRLRLRYAVITSVTRDDLPDGGARQFADTIRAVRRHCQGVGVEVLVPDFKGDEQALKVVFDAWPDVFNHNVETVPRLYSVARPQAIFNRSLQVLRAASDAGLLVKSGLMLGLGETDEEITQTLSDMRQAGCDCLTLGQYLSPSPDHLPVARYVQPHEFEGWANTAWEIGFQDVAAGPLVRSSYRAEQMYSGSAAGCTTASYDKIGPVTTAAASAGASSAVHCQ